MGLSSHVEFVGVVKPIEKLVGAADAVLLPSKWEGLPNAVVESMACATPVLVSPAANADSLVHDGREGFVCERATTDSIARMLERFIALDDTNRRAMGTAGRAHATSRFPVRRMVERTMGVYARVLGMSVRAAS